MTDIPTTEIVALHGDPVWEAIWSVIRTWDIERSPGEGRHGPTGDDVTAIYRAIKVRSGQQALIEGERTRDPDYV